MSSYSFRIRVNLAPTYGVGTQEISVPLATAENGVDVVLTGNRDTPIEKSTQLVLTCSGWPSEDIARTRGEHFADALRLALIRSHVGGELWARRGHGVVTAYGLDMLAQQIGQRVLNDQQGLMIYETDPPARFASFNAQAKVSRGFERFRVTFGMLAVQTLEVTDAERIAIDFFGASFFETAADTRFLMLISAIEALLDPRPRSSDAVALINSFCSTTRAAALPDAERDSLIGALVSLKSESIGQAGRRLVSERLKARVYGGRPAGRFFTDCYRLRSQITHGGNPQHLFEELSGLVADLESFVSDLITVRFVPLESQ